MDQKHNDGHTGSSQFGGAVSTRTTPAPTPPKNLPPYRVLLHNDDVNTDVFVVETIVQLTPLGVPRARSVMVEAHRRGVSLLLVTHKERAELYADQFSSKGLTVTIEPAE
ncbi:MAG: ATP-dependent Clp protease adaptor ClpS [Phycisphaeraceae bacterium]|nr:ATP-dependent Clp protease adaptor ClpS [Phycisphaerae bacterium]MBX3392417.1 ATP-dependent Clp protease adaptor ClpS [Phycisphaeraceae bacterium]